MFLDRIVEQKKIEIEALKQTFRLSEVEKQIAQLPDCRGFESALSQGRNREMALIAEVKKASPSKGLIREDFKPVSLAQEYEESGADCISVLTDIEFFQGHPDYLKAVHEKVSVPCLRKDFTYDYRHVYEARLWGADAILLIAAILKKAEMKEYLGIARDLGMDVLVEVHDRAELETVLELDATLIGINNRNLKTFVTDLKTTEDLISIIPNNVIKVSESGISNPGEIDYLKSLGVDAVLIGEHFMRQPKPGKAIHDLLGPFSRNGLTS
jgi:indole-3-glycerol phosphate synthase